MVFSRPGNGKGHYKFGEILVKYRTGIDDEAQWKAQAKVGGSRIRRYNRIGVERIKLGEGLTVEQAIKTLEKDPAIEYVEPNHRVQFLAVPPPDPQFTQQWYLNTPERSGTIGTRQYPINVDIDAPEGWSVIDALISAPISLVIDQGTIGVVDSGSGERGFVAGNNSGYEPSHIDLPNSILFANTGEIGGNVGWDDDGNGFPDDYNGYDWFDSPDDNAPADSPTDPDAPYHGTIISGILAAAWNGTGIVGVGWDYLNVLPLRAKFVSEIVEAINYAADMSDRSFPVKSINASWKIVDSSSNVENITLRDAIFDAGSNSGIIFYVAAANESSNNDFERVYPADYSRWMPWVITVAATNQSGILAGFSNYGLESVDIAAPGSLVFSTGSGASGYTTKNGTSFATPMVAAIGGLVSAVHPGLSSTEIRARIVNGGEFERPLLNAIASAKKANLAGALAPFYPFSGLALMDTFSPVNMYTDTISQLYGSIQSALSNSNSVAVMVTVSGGAWAVSPVSPGIAEFDLSFPGGAPVTSYRTGPWRIAGIRPFASMRTGIPVVWAGPMDDVVKIRVGDTVQFHDLAPANDWGVSDSSIGTINGSGLFSAIGTGMTMVQSFASAAPSGTIDIAGPIIVFPSSNQIPTVKITDGPRNGQSTINSSPTIFWEGSDTDGFIDHYEYSMDGIGPINTSSVFAAFTSLSEGTHTFTLQAFDDEGTFSPSETLTFTVISGSGGGGGGGGCFIATAAYGSYETPAVKLLREFRDNRLLTNGPGRKLVDLYYRFSPPSAAWLIRHKGVKPLARIALLPAVGFAWLVVKVGWFLSLTLLLCLAVTLLLMRKRIQVVRRGW